MNKIIRLGIILFGITAGTGLVLGAVQTVTKGPIEQQQIKQKNNALAATLPGAVSFDPVAIEGDAGLITEIFEGKNEEGTVGYNFSLAPKGYGGIISLVCGINNEGRVMDITILQSSETPGLGARASEPGFAGQFHEKLSDGALEVTKNPPERDSQIQAISGATRTSAAVILAVNNARSYWAEHFKKEGAN